MDGGLFPAVVTKRPVGLLAQCGACGLFKNCRTPKMPVSGDGRRGILVVAEAPGKDEDNEGKHFVGQAGRYLRRCLAQNGIDLDRDCWKTNALICRTPESRTPTDDEIDYCRPNLKNLIDELQPSHIMVFGRAACVSVLAPYWKEGQFGAMSRWVGWRIPLQAGNCWVTPNFHPNYVLNQEGEQDGPLVRLWFERYLSIHAKLTGRPWETVPDFRRQVRVVMDPDRAAAWLREKLQTEKGFSFDYETDRLKPDSRDSEIVCCSVCWAGQETIAFPWVGNAIAAMDEFTQSPHFKIGANNDFEERWTRRMFGHGVNNFGWDVVLKAHHADNREGITSVKFQALVQLGQSDWSYTMDPYFDGAGGNGKNRIREADLRELLVYNGIDSAVQFAIGLKQKGARYDFEI